MDAATLQTARERLEELDGTAARRARRESVGLGDLEAPAEFNCPISFAPMKDPVVASDGHSYERAEIERWLRGSDRSPITGLPLESTALFPNVNLRQRIEAHEEEVLKVAEKAVENERKHAAAAEAGQKRAGDGGSSSSGAAPKRRRR